jgi:kynureninase
MRWHGLDPDQSLVMLRPRYGVHEITMDDVEQLMEQHGEETAVILLPGVQYYSGQVLPIAEITALAHQHNIIVGFDLAHAAGNISVNLHDWKVDFAVWCSYKYLNSGPGSVGGCFVHQRHATNVDLPRLAGWWGHDKATRFIMENEFRPIPTAEGWQLSNPPILSMAAIRASLDVFAEVGGMPPLVDKSSLMVSFLQKQLELELADRIRIITPENRGCQLSLEIVEEGADGRSVHQRLQQAGAEVDWREPNVIRVAPVPLYNTFEEVWRFVELLKLVLDEIVD